MQEPSTESQEAKKIEEAIQNLLAKRKVGGTICPSEVARKLYSSENWRGMMNTVRVVAITMAHAGRIEITQRRKVVDPRNFTGPIRLRSRHSSKL